MRPFPDLKGQAPLRRANLGQGIDDPIIVLFLTSKVRLHCDFFPVCQNMAPIIDLFLTSKVRLHCDGLSIEETVGTLSALFLTSKVRLHCDHRQAEGVGGQ